MSYQQVFFPLWMGAGTVTNLPQGARDLRAALGGDAVEINVSEHASFEPVDGIKGKTAILTALKTAAHRLEELERVMLLGGDCSSDLALLAHTQRRFAPDLGVVWLDKHADLNTPQSSPSGHFHGQVLRAALGETDPDFLTLIPHPLTPQQVFFGGTGDFDPPELEYLRRHAIPVYTPDALRADPSALARAVVDAGFTRIHVHLDLDVLDANDFTSTGFSSRGGLRVAELEAVIHALKVALEIVSVAVTEYAPRDPRDLETVLRLIRTFQS
jgi:arginase